MSNTKKNFNGTLKIKTKTWEKESYGLFDFEAKDIFCHEFEIERPISIIREQNKINVEKNTKMSKETDLESLCKISKSNGFYTIFFFIIYIFNRRVLYFEMEGKYKYLL